jgi:general secretion pathway protein H
LELLAVIVIIGIIVSFAGLSIGQHSSRTVQDEAERLHGLLRMASEEAVLQGRELALEFRRDGYRFLELGANDWAPVEQDHLFRERDLPPTLRLQLELEGAAANFDDAENPPRVFILSSGEFTPFQLILGIDDDVAYTLEGSIDGKLDLRRSADDENTT